MNQNTLAQLEKNLDKRRNQSLRRVTRLSHQAKKFFERGVLTATELRQKSSQILASAGLTGALLLNPPPINPVPTPGQFFSQTQSFSDSLSKKLSSITPHFPTKLDEDNAKQIEDVIKEETGIPVKATLEGQSLNHQVGYVGYEQHLQRFPGDNIALHDEEQVAGIAPGKGAWGFFAPSQSEFTTKDYQREKYYSVAQTLYLPDWNTNFKYLRDWYKYRKILIVNPKNGEAVVTVLADAGPAQWTGKQFGASPEAMKELRLHLGPRKGLVVFLFIDDPEDKIPLGPLSTKIDVSKL